MPGKILCAALLTLLTACGPDTGRIDAAERLVPEFHLALIDGDFDGIYARAAPELRQAQDAAAFAGRLQRQRAALGAVRGTERVEAAVDGEVVRLRYRTFYERGPASEAFVVRLTPGGAPSLMAYRLLEPALD
ncbi:MAG: hypothetical protein REI09_02465 [Candidatus Dactylopiibacterium sp.]|nr:hypothetical protein [Candidatus Dactylopiibacterium sp.]